MYIYNGSFGWIEDLERALKAYNLVDGMGRLGVPLGKGTGSWTSKIGVETQISFRSILCVGA